MPKVKQIGPYRLHFFSADRREPPHVHVERDKKTAKFWLTPVKLANKRGFTDREIRQVAALVTANEAEVLRVWHERFGR